jgi:hypothetical protein
MKISLPHWIVGLFVILGTIAPQLATAFPAAQYPTFAAILAVIIQVDPLILGALGVTSASIVTSQNASAALKAGAVKALGVLAMVGIVAMALMLVFAPGAGRPDARTGDIVEVTATSGDVESAAVISDFAYSPMSLEGCNANGQLSPVVVTVATETLQLLGCAIPLYATDTSATPVNWTALALALATTCGADVVEIANIFGSSSQVAQAATANAASVHLAAQAFKTKAAVKASPAGVITPTVGR